MRNRISDIGLSILFNKKLPFRKEIDPQLENLLSEDSYSISQYSITSDYFTRRLEEIFTPGNKLLDVGCGIGTWSIAASSVFDYIKGIDVNQDRVKIANILCERAGIKNIVFQNRSIEKLCEEDMEYDSCICINMITFIESSHEMLFRALYEAVKPGGKLYLTAHRSGYVCWLFYQAIKKRSKKKWVIAFNALKHNLKFRIGLVNQPVFMMPPYYVKKIALNSGWKIKHSSYEGGFGKKKTQQLFRRRFLFQTIMQEYIFIK